MLAVPYLLLVLTAAPAPKLHVQVRGGVCRAEEPLVQSLSVHLASGIVDRRAAVTGEDRVVVLSETPGGYRLELRDAVGRRLLVRQLPATCDTVADLASAVLERHFQQVSWPPEAPEVELTSPPPLISLPEPESGFTGALMLGLAATSDGDQPFIPGAQLEGWVQWRWLQAGALAASSLSQSEPVSVRSHTRGEMSSRLDSGALFGSACYTNEIGARVCGGVAAGGLLLTGSASGTLYQLGNAQLVRFAPGATASLQWAPAGHMVVGLRATGLIPLSAPSVLVEGTSAQRTVNFQALMALSMGWSFF